MWVRWRVLAVLGCTLLLSAIFLPWVSDPTGHQSLAGIYSRVATALAEGHFAGFRPGSYTILGLLSLLPLPIYLASLGLALIGLSRSGKASLASGVLGLLFSLPWIFILPVGRVGVIELMGEGSTYSLQAGSGVYLALAGALLTLGAYYISKQFSVGSAGHDRS
ncbi:MAG: hypothetical protein ACE5IB_01235 [Candidatus Geothermarchaeales archaeon]